MRTLLKTALGVGLFLALLGMTRAQDTPKSILEKAAKAHGGVEKLAKDRATTSKCKGTLDIMGMSLEVTQEVVAYSGRFKETMNLTVGGQNVTVVSGYDGKKGWVSVNGQGMDLDDKILDEFKQAANMMRLGKFAFLNDKNYEVSALGEIKIESRAAVGVKVSNKNFRDVNLYFDKESGLLKKMERQALDAQTMAEVTEERIIKEYQEVDGLKLGKKVLVNRDGKKLMDLEVTEVKFLDKVDDSEFAKP